MMGYNHVTCGVIAGLTILPVAPVHDWSTRTAWVIAFGGTALLPDLDSHNATASRMWGPLTGALGGLVATIAGGHRQGTHDAVLAPAAFAAVVAAATLHPIALGVVLAVLIGLALRGIVLSGGGRIAAPMNFLLSLACSCWLVTHGAAHTPLLPWVVAGGVLIHIAGDLLTDEGVPIPILWLLGHRQRLSLGLFTTGRRLEKLLVAPALSILGLWLFCVRVGIHDVTSLAAFSGSLVQHVLPS